jgi:hypothetical protein
MTCEDNHYARMYKTIHESYSDCLEYLKSRESFHQYAGKELTISFYIYRHNTSAFPINAISEIISN